MADQQYIIVEHLCTHYEVNMEFFEDLHQIGLIEWVEEFEPISIEEQQLNRVEKMIRLYKDLHVNSEGIDVIFNLLERMEEMEKEIASLRNKLQFYEYN